jgi:RNA polymerase sigma-70 factor (ECF subfamily)
VVLVSERADADLPAAACRGDAAAFGALIREYDRDLRGVAWSVVRSADRLDDVMQTAYEKAFRSIASFDGRSTLKTWLYSVVYRTALDDLRYEGRRAHQDLDSIRDVAAPGDQSADAALAKVELAAAMNSLRPEQRAALMLTAGLGFSFDEAAEILGESRGTVASRVSRARLTLERWGQS